MPVKRHVRYRQLQDALSLAVGHSQAGRLPVALSYAIDAQHVGNEREPLLVLAGDVERLVAAAMGDPIPERVESWEMIRRPTGSSPLAALQACWHLFPLVAACRLPSLEWAAQIAEQVAAGLASPRAHLSAESWKIAARFLLTTDWSPRELPAVLQQARRAGPGLRVLPRLLGAIASERHEDFIRAEAAARHAGSVWAQISALVWATALSPRTNEARWLGRLLELTGWRRPPLVPPEIAADAALGLVAVGMRGRAVIELAAIAGLPNVTVEVARRHLEEPTAGDQDKFHALDALAALGTTHAQDLLRRTAGRRDEIGRHAAALVARPSHPLGLSEREVEVLDLAGRGLTNRQIGEKLILSVHTIARHLVNSRAKLGAANRAEAAARVARLHR